MKKHCNTCNDSYLEKVQEGRLPFRVTRQRCRNQKYNTPGYTHAMLMEDRKLNHCRFWTPRKGRSAS